MDLNQVKSLFTSTDYERGMEYYQQGRVTDMQCTKTDTETNVSCTVRGAKRYTVQFLRRTAGCASAAPARASPTLAAASTSPPP